ncbi:MAG TPA: hypothetical protein VF064_10135 [Pyrinomonadaceae bacterium]
MSTEASETKNEQTAKQAPTEQQESKAGVPKRFAVGQTVCNQKNEKGKLCNGHLKERNTGHPAEVHLRGDDALHQCQTCGTLYMGPPLGHVRDSRKQSRYVERDLAAILRAAGGTLPAYTYPVPEWRRASLPASAPAAKPTAPVGTPAEAPTPPAAAPPKPAPAARAEARPAPTESAANTTPPPASSAAPEGETPQQKRARIIAELNAKYAGKTAPPRKKKADEETAAAPSAEAAPAPSAQATTGESAPAADASAPIVDSSAEADRHRPAAEAQAATGQASAAPLSPAAATASPAAGAETVADLAPEASTELTPGAPKADAPAAAEPAPEKRKAAGQRNRGPRELPPHLRPPEGETHEEKIARLTAFVEEAKRKAGKL